MPKYGQIFLGKDEKTYGKDGIGNVDYDPDFECGGKVGTPGRRCPHTLSQDKSERVIHYGIASYRDQLCSTTLFNLFTKAEHPERIRVFVLQQNDPRVDPDCLEAYCESFNTDECPHRDSVTIHQIHASEAAGPAWARGRLSQDIANAAESGSVRPQDFCMSTDSHMDFAQNWDTSMIEMWHMAKNEYAVLSTYVTNVDQMDKKSKRNEVPHLCMVTFTTNVRNHATKCAFDLPHPKLTNAIWGAGLSFAKCHAELKVPVDPYTAGIFDGEEFNRSARFFTSGYDIYTPHRVYVFHNYDRSGSQSWRSNKSSRGDFTESNTRLKSIIDLPGGMTDEVAVRRLKRSKYGLGDRRTLDQLIEFSGVDLRNRRKTVDGKNRCGNVRWVPFEEHPLGVDYIPKFDENEDPLDKPDPTSVWSVGNTVEGIGVIKDVENIATKVEGVTHKMASHNVGEDKRFIRKLETGEHFPKVAEHGFHRLPLPVKVTACFLVLGLILTIAYTAGTGRGHKRFRKRNKRT